MLTQETKRKIDSARQILVGKVPDPKAQVEQITIALIYKFMDDMDKEAIELGGKARFFTNGFQKYAWTKLLDQKLGGHERLELYGEAVARMSQNPHIPQLFRDIFKDAFLPYRSPETLTLFLKEINGFTYDDSEDLGNAFEYLLSILGSQGDAGQFRTPRHIIDFIVEVIEPKKGDMILDPACGTAGFLISAYKNILKQQKDKPLTPDEKKKLMNNLVGYDISPDMVKLSKVNMYLHGFAEPKIFEYDTLSSEEKWDESFDVIMANPPFMSPSGGIRPHKRFSVQANRAEVLFVDYIMEHLRPKGRAGIIVPEGVIFQSATAYKALRKALVEDGLFAVVSLPAGVFNPYSGVKTSILFFDNTVAKKTDKILFVRVLSDGFDLGAQRRPVDRNDLIRSDNELDATKILKAQRVAIETGAKNKWLQKNSIFAYEITKKQISRTGDYSLSAERYRLDNLGEQKEQKWPNVLLKDIAFFQEGPGILSSQYVNNGYPMVNVRNVQDGYLDLSDTKFVSEEMANGKWSHFRIEKGDVLFTTSGTIGRVARVEEKNLPLLLNTSVVRFRPLDQNQLNSDYLFYVLKSKNFLDELLKFKTGSAQFNVGPTHLKQLSIPLPPIEVQKEIVEQIEVKQNAIEHAKAIIENLEGERRYFGKSLEKFKDVKRVEIGTICNLINGKAFKPSDWQKQESGGLPIIRIQNLNNENASFNYYTGKVGKQIIINTGDLLFSWSGSRGTSFGAHIWKGKEAILNQHIFKVEHSDDVNRKYLYLVLNDAVSEIEQNLHGGVGLVHITKGNLEKIKIPIPSLQTQKQIVADTEKEEEFITANRRLIDLMENKISEVLSTI